MDSLLKFYPTIVSVFKNLSYLELLSLSLASKGWFEATNQFVINRTVLQLEKSLTDRELDGMEFIRKYKDVKVKGFALKDVLPKVPDSLESLVLEFINIDIEAFKLQRFKKLKSLTISHCIFYNIDQLKRKNLELGLQSLELDGCENYLNVYKELIEANGSIRSLEVYLFLQSDMLNKFLKSIRLPKLQEISIIAYDLNEGLKALFQNHKDIRSCYLKHVKIKDETIAVLRNCEKLEKVSLEAHKHSELTGRTFKELSLMKVTKHLDLYYANITGDALQTFNPSRVESLNIHFDTCDAIQIQSMLMMTNVRVLKLSGNSNITDCSILSIIVEKMPHLVDLSLFEFPLNSDNEIKRISNSGLDFKRLEKLEISDIHEQLLRLINAPKLKVLHLHEDHIKSLRHFGNCSPLIEELKWWGGSPDEADVSCITENLPCLRILEFRSCKISSACFKEILTNSSIERGFLNFCSLDADFKDLAKLEEGFVFNNRRLMISNGARRFVFDF